MKEGSYSFGLLIIIHPQNSIPIIQLLRPLHEVGSSVVFLFSLFVSWVSKPKSFWYLCIVHLNQNSIYVFRTGLCNNLDSGLGDRGAAGLRVSSSGVQGFRL